MIKPRPLAVRTEKVLPFRGYQLECFLKQVASHAMGFYKVKSYFERICVQSNSDWIALYRH